MTRYIAVTTCNADQWKRFGRRMVQTFCQYWPPNVALEVYCEGFWSLEDVKPDPSVPSPWLGYLDLEQQAPWQPLFEQLYSAPQFNGGSGGRDYRRDAVRFSHKIAALGAAAETVDCDVLIWIDADVITHAPVTIEWLDGLFPEHAELAWLDRERTYPECGFMMFRMPGGVKIIKRVVTMYRGGEVFSLPETHDSFVFQHVVQGLQRKGEIKVHSLSGPEGRKHIGHPWCSSPLAAKMDHLKGERRKERGSSLKSDMVQPRTEKYWRNLKA